jgi:hypothetical protein
MPNQFQRGFEAFGRPIPIRGQQQQQPASLGAAPPPPPAAAPQEDPAPVPAPVAQTRPVPPGRIKVYKKGEPGAPPCPVCH